MRKIPWCAFPEDKEKAVSYFYQKSIKDDMGSYVKLNDMLLVKQAELRLTG